MHEHAVIAVEPPALTVLAPHEVHVPPRLGVPQELAAHEHAVIAVEPAALTALAPHETHIAVAVPASCFHQFGGQSPVDCAHTFAASFHIVPASQSPGPSAHTVAASSPAAGQQQRRAAPLDDSPHVDLEETWK